MSRPALDIFPPDQQFFLSDGSVNNAGYMYVYEPDQAYSTQKTVYKDRAKGTQWTQPITFDTEGRMSSPVKSDGLVDIKIFDSDDNLIETHDNAGDDWSAVGTDLSENLVSNHSFETAGTGGEPFANWTATDSGSVITRDSATSSGYHGAAYCLFSNSQNGSDYITSDAYEVTPAKDLSVEFLVKADNTSARPQVKIQWLDYSQSNISTTTIYDSSEGVTPTLYSIGLVQGLSASPPTTARYFKLIIVGNADATQYTVRFEYIYVKQVSRNTFGVVTRIPVGLNLSIDAGDTNHDVNVTAGAVLDSTYSKEIVLASEITKKIDAGWAVGDDAGGLASGSSLPASGQLHVYVGLKSATGLVDVFFDDDHTLSPTPPTGFDFYRYLGTVLTDSSSNLLDMAWYGEHAVILGEPPNVVSDSSLTSGTAETGTANLPPECDMQYTARVEILSGGAATDIVGHVRPKDSSWSDSRHGHGLESTSDDLDEMIWEGSCRIDSSRQFEYEATWSGHSGDESMNIWVTGFVDYRRNNP